MEKNNKTNNKNLKKQTTTFKRTIERQEGKRKNSFEEILKARYTKACFMMAKIKNNARNGTPHVNDKKDRIKYQAVIDEYRIYKEIQSETEKQCQQSREKKRMSEEKTSLAKKEVIIDELCMVLVNQRGGKLKPVVKEWPMIENKISEILLNYLLHNKDCPIPRYESGKIYQGYMLIQCKNKFSKEFLYNCVTKVRDEFEGMTLTVIPAEKIPLTQQKNPRKNIPPTPANSSEEVIIAPPPPTWTNVSDIEKRDNEQKKDIVFTPTERCLKNYDQTENLNRRDRRRMEREQRIIRDYEMEQKNKQNTEPGFQLSINYFERDCHETKGEVMSSKKSTRHDNSFNYLYNEMEKTTTRSNGYTKSMDGKNLKQQSITEFPKTSWENNLINCNINEEILRTELPQTTRRGGSHQLEFESLKKLKLNIPQQPGSHNSAETNEFLNSSINSNFESWPISMPNQMSNQSWNNTYDLGLMRRSGINRQSREFVTNQNFSEFPPTSNCYNEMGKYSERADQQGYWRAGNGSTFSNISNSYMRNSQEANCSATYKPDIPSYSRRESAVNSTPDLQNVFINHDPRNYEFVREDDHVSIRDMTRRSIISVWIPPPVLENDEVILKILRAQNYRLSADCWTLINSSTSENNKGKTLYISVSAKSLERLKIEKGEIRYGIDRLQVNFSEEWRNST